MSRRDWKLTTPVAVVAACAGLAASSRALGQSGTPAQAMTLVGTSTPSSKPAMMPMGPSLAAGAVIPSIRLGAIDVAMCLAEDAAAAASGDKRLRYGLGRAVSFSTERGRWFDVTMAHGGGRVWLADIAASGAMGLRVHLRDLRLPPGATVVVYSPDDPAFLAGPYEGVGPRGDGQVWTPTRPGERVRIECRVPHLNHGEVPAVVPFRVDGVQHIYRDPTNPGDGPCHNDVTCFPAWSDVSKACAGVGFINQNSLFCSGQLLNTLAGDQTPYFMTSNTCVGTAAIAQTCEVYFHYRTASCNGALPALSSVPRATGCTLLAGSAAADFSLLMVEGTLPSGVMWAGWTTVTPADGSLVATVHQPQGGAQRISFGVKASNSTCGGAGYTRSNWVSGPTEPGSGGAGLYTDDVNKQLVGVLSCGWSSCGNVTNDSFSPFSVIHAAVASLLLAGPDDAFEPNDRCSGAFGISPGSYTSRIVKSSSEDWFRAIVAPGATFSAQLSFVHANGDIDVELFTVCDGIPVAVSAGQTGSESVSWINDGEQPHEILLRVYLASDTRNTYSMAITNGVPPGFGACCLPANCSILPASACAASGGVYAGDSTTCATGCHTYTYTGPAVSIIDGSGGCGSAAVCTVTVPESFPVSNLGVGVRIVHGYQGDVKFSLKHVGTGTTVALVDRPGVPPSTFGFPQDNYGASATNLFRSLDAAPQRYDSPVAGVDNVSGVWKPESPLAAFVGLPSAGQWQLLVQDCAVGETGQVVAFALTLGRGASNACYANCDQSASPPVLTANDFLCFVNLFAEGSSLANCDGSTVAPVLTGNDFQCFLTSYVVGCS